MQSVFKTERTLVRTMDVNDATALRAYLLKNIEHHKPWEPTRSRTYYELPKVRSRIKAHARQQKEGASLILAAFSHDQTELLALCNFTNIVHGVFLACNLGFSISKQYEGHGMMFEILDMSIKHVFDELKLHRVMANYIPQNSRSATLLSRLGFEKEGVAKSYLKIAGKWQDHVLTSRIARS